MERTNFGGFLLLLLMATGCSRIESGSVGNAASPPVPPGSPPQLPQVQLDTTLPQQSGRTIRIAACGRLQGAINEAALGDTIVVDAKLTCQLSLTLPEKTKGTGWILIQSSAMENLPPPGTRVIPAQHAQWMPKIYSDADNKPAVRALARAHHFRLIGLEIGLAEGITSSDAIVKFDSAAGDEQDYAHDLIVDRCYVHGNPTGRARRGINVNAKAVAIVDSHVSEIHEAGADSQAVCGWNTPGPIKIENNYLEAAGENLMFGGAGGVVAGVIPSDIEIRRNHFFKPLRWRVGHPSFEGKPWSVKNILELKNAQRVLIEGNVFENNWAHAQVGFAIVITPRVERPARSVPQAVTSDITIRYNILRHAGSGFNMLGRDEGSEIDQAQRILIQDNLIIDVSGRWGGQGRLFQVLSGVHGLTIEHNTCFQSGPMVVADGAPPSRNFVFQDNITAMNQGVVGSGTAPGDGAFARYFPDVVFTHNAMVGGGAGMYPGKNFFVGEWEKVKFLNLEAGDFRLATGSKYRKAGTDGRDLGADMDAIAKATAGVVINP